MHLTAARKTVVADSTAEVHFHCVINTLLPETNTQLQPHSTVKYVRDL